MADRGRREVGRETGKQKEAGDRETETGRTQVGREA